VNVLQDIAASVQHHAAIDELRQVYGACQGRHGEHSLAALQCLRNLAQGYCVQGMYAKAEKQLNKALRSIDRQTFAASGCPPIHALVLKAGVTFELADVLAELKRSASAPIMTCSAYVLSH